MGGAGNRAAIHIAKEAAKGTAIVSIISRKLQLLEQSLETSSPQKT